MKTGMGAASESGRARNFIVAQRRDLGIELANTLMWRGSSPEETLHGPDDLLGWLASAKALPRAAVAGLRKWFAARPGDAAAVFDEAIELREIIYALLHSAASDSAPAPGDLRRFNRALASAPVRESLERANGGFGWRVEVRPAAAAMLAAALWSAADILAGADRARLRECANHRCLWLFLDDSKNRTRRWCSMQSCGNRAKAHRHYLRSRRG
jgi:predicted RNA-binding Zn ribbon-like protein